MSAEPYVFAAGEPPPGVSAFAVIREDEGVTLILTHDHLFVGWDQGARALALLHEL